MNLSPAVRPALDLRQGAVSAWRRARGWCSCQHARAKGIAVNRADQLPPTRHVLWLGDLLRLAHPKAPSAEREAVFRWILSGAEGLGERTVKRGVNGEDRVATYAAARKLPAILEAFEKAKKASSKAEIVTLINDCDLPREAIPAPWFKEAAGSVYGGLLRGHERGRFSGMSATLTVNLDSEILQLAEQEARARHTTLPEVVARQLRVMARNWQESRPGKTPVTDALRGAVKLAARLQRTGRLTEELQKKHGVQG